MRRGVMALAAAGVLLVLANGCGEDAKNAMGGTCVADGDCADGKCHAGTCVSLAPVDVGAACTMNAECKSLLCASGKCATGTSAKDAKCLNKEECASGSCEGGVCALKADGADCTKADECKGGTCYNSKCTSKKADGGDCTQDADCAGAACYAKKCVKTCTKSSDCASTEVCTSDDGKRLICITPTYKSELGKSCGVRGSCADSSLKCLGTLYDFETFCTSTCTGDTDCPPSMQCDKPASGDAYCRPRGDCATCLTDDFCPSSHKCIATSGGKYCLPACSSNTECPMYMECKDGGSAGKYCMHKNGKCSTDGTLCSSCSKSQDCKSGGLCLTFNLTGESFCGSDCTSSGTCSDSSNYSCSQISSTSSVKQCIPKAKGSPPYYTCTSGITYPVYNVGDTIDDFGMVGYNDSDNDGDYSDETLRVIKLSDFSKTHKLILLNIAAFW